MIATELYVHLMVVALTAASLIFACWATVYCKGLNQRMKQNEASHSGPATWSEVIAFRIVMNLFRRAHLSDWRERLRRNVFQWILSQMRLKNHSWTRDLSDGKTCFVWKVRMPVLYGALELPDKRRLEVLLPLKGATDKDLKNFEPSTDLQKRNALPSFPPYRSLAHRLK